MYEGPRRPADQAFTNVGVGTHDAGDDTPAERGARHGFWSELADIVLSMPAGVGVRLSG